LYHDARIDEREEDFFGFQHMQENFVSQERSQLLWDSTAS
jgi:hypothetical protein